MLDWNICCSLISRVCCLRSASVSVAVIVSDASCCLTGAADVVPLVKRPDMSRLEPKMSILLNVLKPTGLATAGAEALTSCTGASLGFQSSPSSPSGRQLSVSTASQSLTSRSLAICSESLSEVEHSGSTGFGPYLSSRPRLRMLLRWPMAASSASRSVVPRIGEMVPAFPRRARGLRC